MYVKYFCNTFEERNSLGLCNIIYYVIYIYIFYYVVISICTFWFIFIPRYLFCITEDGSKRLIWCFFISMVLLFILILRFQRNQHISRINISMIKIMIKIKIMIISSHKKDTLQIMSKKKQLSPNLRMPVENYKKIITQLYFWYYKYSLM